MSRQREEQMMNLARLAELNSRTVDLSKKEVFMSAYIQGWKDADSHPHWIPVEEYPKVDISCTLLVHYVDGEIDICDYYGDFYDYTGQNVTRNVTHWMPLPQPPRKEE